MRSILLRKQPSIATYSDEPNHHLYTDMTRVQGLNMTPMSSFAVFPTKTSSEMTNAIRRQRRTSGVSYWTHSTVPHRHGSREAFHHLFSSSMNGLGGVGQEERRTRPIGTNFKPDEYDVFRTCCSADLLIPRAYSKQSAGDQGKVVDDTEVPCTVNSESPNQLEYFYQLYRAKFRYTDYLEQGASVIKSTGVVDMPLRSVTNGYDISTEKTMPRSTRRPVKLTHSMRTFSLPTMVPRSSVGGPDVFSHSTVSARSSHVRRPDGRMDVFTVKQPFKQAFVGSTVHGRNNKSHDLAVKGTMFSLNSTNSRGMKPVTKYSYGNIRVNPTSHNNTSNFVLANSPTNSSMYNSHLRRKGRPLSVPRVRLSKDLSTVGSAKRRTVHFSGANEIYEYSPAEPVMH